MTQHTMQVLAQRIGQLLSQPSAVGEETRLLQQLLHHACQLKVCSLCCWPPTSLGKA